MIWEPTAPQQSPFTPSSAACRTSRRAAAGLRCAALCCAVLPPAALFNRGIKTSSPFPHTPPSPNTQGVKLQFWMSAW